MGHQVDAHTQFLDRRRLLEHLAVDAVLVQEKRGGQSADTRTYDDRLHVDAFTIALAAGCAGILVTRNFRLIPEDDKGLHL